MREEARVGVYICHCGQNIAGILNPLELVNYAKELPGVVWVTSSLYTCSESGQQEIKEDISRNRLDAVVVAACSVRMHEPTFRNCVIEAGLNPFKLEMVNLREHVSWVHHDNISGAMSKAKDQLSAAVAKVRLNNPLEYIEFPVTNKTLVIGGGIAGITAALDLADAGVETYLVEREPSLGGRMAQLSKTFPTMDCPI